MSNSVSVREHLQRHPLLTLPQILGEIPGYKSEEDTLRLVPVSKSGWHNGIAAGYFPAPVKMGRKSLWRAADIARLLQIEI